MSSKVKPIQIGDQVVTPHGKTTTIVAIKPGYFYISMMNRPWGYQDADGHWWLSSEVSVTVTPARMPANAAYVGGGGAENNRGEHAGS